MLNSDSAAEIASNAFLKLCKLDVRDETERWARTAPKFTTDGRVAVITIHSGFQGKWTSVRNLPQSTQSLRLDGRGILDAKARSL